MSRNKVYYFLAEVDSKEYSGTMVSCKGAETVFADVIKLVAEMYECKKSEVFIKVLSYLGAEGE